MPTYTCWATADTIGAGARRKIVEALTEIHHEVAVAPRYFVQVVFNDLAPGSIYIAGQPADTGHLWIRADIRAGRTDKQKTTLLDRITTEVGQILDVAPEEVWVYICDIPGGNIAEYGRALPNPGEEDQWFDALPNGLQHRLEPLR
jgi:phenylpyruvate tautomerase PptA (4-oxalocrotonate tautomerase family)